MMSPEEMIVHGIVSNNLKCGSIERIQEWTQFSKEQIIAISDSNRDLFVRLEDIICIKVGPRLKQICKKFGFK